MTILRRLAVAVLATIAGLSGARADGNLFMYNWADYAAPELLAKFEKETGIKVTLDTYDTNETLLAKLKQGGTGYDIIVPTDNFVRILIQEGLIQKINAQDLPNYGNIEDRWKSPEWDPGNQYTVPWQWGTTSFSVDTTVYSGDIDTYATLFDPPAALQGKIGMFRTPNMVIPMAQIYLGLPLCNESPEDMQKVSELLERQKAFVKIYSSDGILERLVSGDTAMHANWNGAAQRARAQKPSLRYAYPREGVITWVDTLAVPIGAPNYENALKFIDFYLRPENAGLESNYAGYANGIKGSDVYMKEDIKDAPEMNPPAGMKPIFQRTCSEKSIKLADRVWTKLLE